MFKIPLSRDGQGKNQPIQNQILRGTQKFHCNITARLESTFLRTTIKLTPITLDNGYQRTFLEVINAIPETTFPRSLILLQKRQTSTKRFAREGNFSEIKPLRNKQLFLVGDNPLKLAFFPPLLCTMRARKRCLGTPANLVLYGLIFPLSIPAERDFERVAWLLSQEQRQANAIGRSLCRRTVERTR